MHACVVAPALFATTHAADRIPGFGADADSFMLARCPQVGYYTFHDRDVAPEGKDLVETNEILDEVTDYMLKKQRSTGVKLLWGTANLFSHPR